MGGPEQLLPLEAALALLLRDLPAPQTEMAILDVALLGRSLAQDVRAPLDQPPFAASAMDGYALRRCDLTSAATRLPIIGEARAGLAGLPLAPGSAMRILTGAPVPDGADLVIPQERVAVEDGFVILASPHSAEANDASNIRRRGGDFGSGDLLLGRGLRLDPWRLSLLASAGLARVELARQPRILVLATGEELVRPGEVRRADQVFDSNSFAIEGLIRLWGGVCTATVSAGDDIAEIAQKIGQAGGDIDLIVTLGGASVGKYDLVKPALMPLGLSLIFERLRIRPGKPCWFGKLGDGTLVLGLPGNPSAALVTAQLLLKPLLLAMQGADPTPIYEQARMMNRLEGGIGWERFIRAHLTNESGIVCARSFEDQDSSRVRIFAQSNALIRLEPTRHGAVAGETVEVLRLDRIG